MILAADTGATARGYDPAEPNEPGQRFQDFGHSHWHNSLIWGETSRTSRSRARAGSTGKGLEPRDRRTREDLDTRRGRQQGDRAQDSAATSCSATSRSCAAATSRSSRPAWTTSRSTTSRSTPTATASTSTAAATCASPTAPSTRRTTTASASRAPTRSAPRARRENVTITNCIVSGYDDRHGARRHVQARTRRPPDRDGPTGRIKFGTESNGGFRNITISNMRVRSTRAGSRWRRWTARCSRT